MLELCQEFFGSLNTRGIRYCHWKSNSHLGKALDGKTDLDVLVHSDDKRDFEAEMHGSGFKEILSPPEKQFPGLKDYLGFDDATGELVHLHVHYRLVMGRRFIKNHHLPIESLYFDNLTEQDGVKIPSVELELVMLILRAHLKVDYVSLAKHAVKDLMGHRYTAFPADIENEFRELRESADMDEFARLLGETGLPLARDWCERFLDRFANGKLRSWHIWRGHYYLRRLLRPYRRDSGLSVMFDYSRQVLSNSALAGLVFKGRRKVLPEGGRVFSIIGADGSGKSTLIGDLGRWLSWKLEVRQLYYGIPKDWFREASTFLMRVFNKLGMRRLCTLVEHAFWLHVAKSRQHVSRQSVLATARGQVVITDRFPLPDFRTMSEPMDNPRIDPSATVLGRNLREREEALYAGLRAPDLALVLQVEIEELRRRKSDLPRATHALKAAAVNEIVTRDGLATIDANRPYEAVLLDAKRLIWASL